MTSEKKTNTVLVTMGGCAIFLAAFCVLGFSCMATTIGLASDNAGFGALPQATAITEVHQEGAVHSAQKIAVIKLSGTLIEDSTNSIYSQGISRQFASMLKSAKEDTTVSGVLLWIDSPGGSVTDSDILLSKLKALAKEKPVLFLMDDICASGCVYTAIGATEIWALPTTITGSIGVIIQGLNVSEFLTRHGIQDRSITSGKHKALLSPTRPVDEEGQKIVQGIVDAMYSRFVSLISKNRNLPVEEIKSFADGRIFTAEQAKDLKLIDQVGHSDAALKRLKELAQAPDDIQVVQYKHQPSIYDFLQQKFFGGSIEGELIQHLSVWPRVMLLPGT